ncbi:MAG: peptidase domain-containing ABC transporter [Cyanobacteria bacterium P01_F01_bin.33]
MTSALSSFQTFLAGVPPFDGLDKQTIERLITQIQPLRYRMGQAIVVRDKLPHHVAILYEGRARLLGYPPNADTPTTLQLLEPGAVVGWVGLIRGVPCETAISSTEAVCLSLPAKEFLDLLERDPEFNAAFQKQCSPIEIFDLLRSTQERQANANYDDLKDLALKLALAAKMQQAPRGRFPTTQLDPEMQWFVSGGGKVSQAQAGTVLDLNDPSGAIEVLGPHKARLIGLPKSEVSVESVVRRDDPSDPWSDNGAEDGTEQNGSVSDSAISYAPEEMPVAPISIYADRPKRQRYPHFAARGQLEATLACFQMLCKHLGVPFRRDQIKRVLAEQLKRTGSLSLMHCGAVSEMIGLNAQLVTIPARALGRLQAPALIQWGESFALLYEIDQREIVVGSPEAGIFRRQPEDISATWEETGQVLMLQRTKSTPQQKFGLQWFLPSLVKYRRVLFEVLIASFFVQLFGLANPLMIQVIIDKVIVQNSIDTLHVLGVFLLVVALFEALLTSLRTYLFVDTTNRIDMSLGSEIIDHLFRLPLRYFERRPVGELASRVNELENIRSFLTGTALTVVLDAIFSVVYIVVMFIYSWLLTLVALTTIPLFVALTLLASPIIRRQLRTKAERNAQTQSYLVEALSGVQTVKAQNIELRSRWQWQERYARYVSAGFQTVLTSTAASSTSNFLNKLSALLVLWVGAYLVLQGQLTLGQLIAFRIISGYVTQPLLRLAQLWQNFQQTALSLERLSDIIDTPQEADEENRDNIPLPPIVGNVRYEGVSFRFGQSGPPQLNNIELEFPAGTFVGIVGQSGSGKSTLMKLLPRLYEPNSGRIFIDNYDIGKVELYSLRRQVGIVPQDCLLFDASVQENIALTNPNATSEEIVEAAKAASAHEFIMGLPAGYNTRVGERGSALSGGQRQRIAIARTILQNPRLLILDEATSALDYETEYQVSANLNRFFHDRTVFFITHRLSTIRHADIILMMSQGTVIELGTHEELMAKRGSYYCLYQQQEAEA